MPHTPLAIRKENLSPRSWGWLLLPTAFLLLLGCKGVRYDTQEWVKDTFTKPDPVQVVKTTTSGDRRAKFIPALYEPARHGGDKEQQDEVLTLLLTAAVGDPAPTCRLQAIRTLGSYKDPRAVEGLQAAYYKATTFSPYTNNLIRQQALQSLAQTGDPKARDLLVRVARAGAREKEMQDQQLTLDERLAAIRGLANFKSPEVTSTLVHLLKSEKDVAIRDRCRESLQKITNLNLPADAQAWEQALAGNIPDSARPSLLPNWLRFQ